MGVCVWRKGIKGYSCCLLEGNGGGGTNKGLPVAPRCGLNQGKRQGKERPKAKVKGTKQIEGACNAIIKASPTRGPTLRRGQ